MLAKLAALTLPQRLALLAVVAFSVVTMAGVTYFGSQPDMQLLFTNLSPDDAGSIVEKLKELKVPYALGTGGASILVPAEQVHDLRIQLASQGLPHGGGVGFELFDRSMLGVSDFVQKLNYRRALQGELARTIAQMPQVERARVHLAIPERRLFSGDRDRTHASVVVGLRQEGALSPRQIQGIVHLVASSVEGLRPQDVTVVDGRGQLISDSPTDGPTHLSGSQREHQLAYEKSLETRIQTMLEKIVGANKAIVRVSSEMDFRHVETTEETYDPTSQVARSEHRNQEQSQGVTTGPSGVPGPESSLPKPDGSSTGSAPSTQNDSRTKSETINYEISRTVSKIVEPTGSVTRLSVAVMIDGTYERPSGDQATTPSASPKYLPRSEEEIKKFEDLVKKAMGYSEERGDQVEVVNLQFGFEGVEDGPGAIATANELPTAVVLAPYLRYGLLALVILLVIFVVVRPLLKIIKHGMTPNQATPTLPAPDAYPMSISQLEAATATAGDHALHPKVIEFARKDPESAALIVKNWLK